MIASSPAARSAAQAAKASWVVVARSPTCTRPWFEVEVECGGVAVAEGEGGGGFGGVGEAVQFGELEGAVGVFDVAEDAAGADGGELLVVTDQPDTPTQRGDEVDDSVEGEGVGHPGLVDDHQGPRADPGRPVGQLDRAAGTR